MLQDNPLQYLPTEEDLLETDNKPVDNELQLLIPTLLRAILLLAWAERTNWFFGANLGVYYAPNEPAISPDAFLSLGVPRIRSNGQLRLSYVIWQENNVVPLWVLEIVSKKLGGEYGSKLRTYAEMGVLYYTLYNPDYWQRDGHAPFEVYKLVNGTYIRQLDNPVWMPEVGLGIGVAQGTHDRYSREWLYWYDEQGNRLPAPENIIQQERSRAEQDRQRAEQAEQQLEDLINKLKARGIDPDTL